MLAHEFQHALEIGVREDVVDPEAMEAMYEDVAVQDRVFAELNAGSSEGPAN